MLFHGEQVTMQERAATAQETQVSAVLPAKTAARTALSGSGRFAAGKP